MLWVKSHQANKIENFNRVFNDFIATARAIALEHKKVIGAPGVTPEPNKPATTKIQKEQPTTPKKPSIPNRTQTKFPPKPAPKVTTAFQGRAPINTIDRDGKYIVKTSDFPFAERQTCHRWRHLQQPQKIGQDGEIDVTATINLMSRQGMMIEPIRLRAKVNLIEIVVFEDREGSMVPFRPIIDELFATIEPNKFNQIYRYYCRNCPGDFVYLQPKGTEILGLEALPLSKSRTVAVVISDAGAMRGGYNPERLEMTQKFLDYIAPKVMKILWINPLPAERWQGTTAQAIEQQCLGKKGMFELSADGLQLAVRT